MSEKRKSLESGIVGGATLRKELPLKLFDIATKVKTFGWNFETIETENKSPEDHYGEYSYRGELEVRITKRGIRDDGGDDQVHRLANIQSDTQSKRRVFDGDDPNDRFTDRYFYDFNMEQMRIDAEDVVRKIHYFEAGGDPNQDVWPINPDNLREFYLEIYSSAKVLIEGWSKSFDQSRDGKSTKLDQNEIERMEKVSAAICSAIIRSKNDYNQNPTIVSAGNSAGVQKLVSKELETAQCSQLYSLPQVKDPNRYIEPSQTLVLQAPPRDGANSQWGDELVGETGIASIDFSVKAVIIAGGGENLAKQIPIYLDNVLKAKQNDRLYLIATVQGIGGISSKERIVKLIRELSSDQKYASLQLDRVNSDFPPDWLQFLETDDMSSFENEIDTLLMRVHYSH
ncbi:MAG: hypothetical protein ABFQ62_05295 [Patescibacteria group bacterium]